MTGAGAAQIAAARIELVRSKNTVCKKFSVIWRVSLSTTSNGAGVLPLFDGYSYSSLRSATAQKQAEEEEEEEETRDGNGCEVHVLD